MFDTTLLQSLCEQPPHKARLYGEWLISPVAGGANNRLLRASGPQGDYALKFMRNDARNRAGREYAALCAIWECRNRHAAPLAAEPVLLMRDLPYPLVIQRWLIGKVLQTPPRHDADWLMLLEHYAAIHCIKPEHTSMQLPASALNFSSVAHGKQVVHEHVALLPASEQSPNLLSLVARLDAWHAPEWPAPAPALCRTDANFRNIIRRPGGWASVDWENSGWGDPAFEMADLITHVAYLEVAQARWEWVRDTYAQLAGDANTCQRINGYVVILLVWWVVRMARYRYEMPRGLDTRLVALAEDWEVEMIAKQQHYIGAADIALRGVGV